MKRSSIASQNWSHYLIGLLLILVPFHAFISVWGSSLFGHYIALRLWDDLLLIVLMGSTFIWILRDAALRTWLFGSLLFRLIAAYAGLTLLLGVIAFTKGEAELKALGYGILVNLRFLLWFIVVVLAARKSDWLATKWTYVMLPSAAMVVLFGALQYAVLPHDFLTHFGYDTHTTIAPIETINHNDKYIRVQSTLRGANPLGAYLVVVLAALSAIYVHGRRRLVCVLFGALGVFTLYASGSRSAWIGTLLSLVVIYWLCISSRRGKIIFSAVGLGVVALAAGTFYLLKENTALQNAVLHTEDRSQVATSSNDAHVSAVMDGLKDAVHQPLGDGPGTAGPASVYNGEHPVRIAENYYVQIIQEVGWLGLALFVSILVLIGVELYQRIGGSPLALALLASLVGISFVGMLSHVWTDDTLAFIWWGFAGLTLGVPPVRPKKMDA